MYFTPMNLCQDLYFILFFSEERDIIFLDQKQKGFVTASSDFIFNQHLESHHSMEIRSRSTKQK